MLPVVREWCYSTAFVTYPLINRRPEIQSNFMALLATYKTPEESISHSSSSMSAPCLHHARQKMLKTFLAGKQQQIKPKINQIHGMAHKHGNMTTSAGHYRIPG